MTTTTTPLTAFLLDRIAEDERRTIGYVDEDRSSSWHALGCGLNDDPGTWCECAVPARVRAECAAKRAIVAAMVESDADGSVYFERGLGLDLALRHLAAVHADHPDCDESWRP